MSADDKRIKAAIGQDISFEFIDPNDDTMLLKETPFLNIHASPCVDNPQQSYCDQFYGGA